MTVSPSPLPQYTVTNIKGRIRLSEETSFVCSQFHHTLPTLLRSQQTRTGDSKKRAVLAFWSRIKQRHNFFSLLSPTSSCAFIIFPRARWVNVTGFTTIDQLGAALNEFNSFFDAHLSPDELKIDAISATGYVHPFDRDGKHFFYRIAAGDLPPQTSFHIYQRRSSLAPLICTPCQRRCSLLHSNEHFCKILLFKSGRLLLLGACSVHTIDRTVQFLVQWLAMDSSSLVTTVGSTAFTTSLTSSALGQESSRARGGQRETPATGYHYCHLRREQRRRPRRRQSLLAAAASDLICSLPEQNDRFHAVAGDDQVRDWILTVIEAVSPGVDRFDPVLKNFIQLLSHLERILIRFSPAPTTSRVCITVKDVIVLAIAQELMKHKICFSTQKLLTFSQTSQTRLISIQKFLEIFVFIITPPRAPSYWCESLCSQLSPPLPTFLPRLATVWIRHAEQSGQPECPRLMMASALAGLAARLLPPPIVYRHLIAGHHLGGRDHEEDGAQSCSKAPKKAPRRRRQQPTVISHQYLTLAGAVASSSAIIRGILGQYTEEDAGVFKFGISMLEFILAHPRLLFTICSPDAVTPPKYCLDPSRPRLNALYSRLVNVLHLQSLSDQYAVSIHKIKTLVIQRGPRLFVIDRHGDHDAHLPWARRYLHQRNLSQVLDPRDLWVCSRYSIGFKQ